MALYKHQREAVERYSPSDVTAIPIFFDTGVGKTLTAITIACRKYEQGDIDAVLVIAPNGVDYQWQTEQIPHWCTSEYVCHPKLKAGRQGRIPFDPTCLNWCCVNVEKFSTQSAYQPYVDWHNEHRTMIILDEATTIKTPTSLRSQRIIYGFNNVLKRGRSIIKSESKSVARMILTGTPVSSGPFGVWSMFEFLQPNYFNMNYFAFQNRYGMFCSMIVNGRSIRILLNEDQWTHIKHITDYGVANAKTGVSFDTYSIIQSQDHFEGPYRNTEELRQRIAKDAMFVRLTDVYDMPERVYDRKLIPMTDEQAKAYYQMEKDLLALLGGGKAATAQMKVTAYIRLQQIASGFVSAVTLPPPKEGQEAEYNAATSLEEKLMYADTYGWDFNNEITWFDKVPKMDALAEDISILPAGEQVIIVCHFSAEAERIFNFLTEKGITTCLRTGWKKVGSEEDWKEGRYQVMVANIKVISMGFNYQNAHRMIFYSNTFSLEDRMQVEARIFRLGQTHPCIYTDYVAVDTIDMKVYAVLKQKKSLADYIVNNSIESMLCERDEVFDAEYGDVAF